MAENTTPERGWRNFYGRRHGKTLRDSQKEYLETDLKEYTPEGVTWEENPDRKPLDLKALFGDREIWLETGFGGGEHMVHQAVQNPDVGILADLRQDFGHGIAFTDDQLGVDPLTVPHPFGKDFVMGVDAFAGLFTHDLADTNPVVELIGGNHRQDRNTAPGVGGPHGGEPHGVQTFAAVVQNDQKLAHGPIAPFGG